MFVQKAAGDHDSVIPNYGGPHVDAKRWVRGSLLGEPAAIGQLALHLAGKLFHGESAPGRRHQGWNQLVEPALCRRNQTLLNRVPTEHRRVALDSAGNFVGDVDFTTGRNFESVRQDRRLAHWSRGIDVHTIRSAVLQKILERSSAPLALLLPVGLRDTAHQP